MLIQFMLKNVLSFKTETVLDMTAINAYKEHEYNLIKHGKEKFLKVLSIYGANASGKSNLHQAMSLFQKIVLESSNNVYADELTAIQKYYVPFEFEERSDNSEFQIVFIAGNYEYRYGFEYNDKRIVSEWLYRKNEKTNRTVTVFERTVETILFGATVRRTCEKYKNQIPCETLVLSFFNKLNLNTDIFRIVFSHTMDTLVVTTDFCENPIILSRYLPDIIDDDEEKNSLLNFLGAIDLGIKDISYEEIEKEIRFFTTHFGKDEKKYVLNLSAESEGTLKSIMLYIYAQMAIMNNASLFIDELNTKLHPLLLKFIIDLFNDSDSMAQLIYTTHDTTLMDKKFFRRDQILFVQKDIYGYSELFALSDFKVRSDASFEKDYLAGVYGGIPQLKNFSVKNKRRT